MFFLCILFHFWKVHHSSFIGNSLPSVPLANYLWQYTNKCSTLHANSLKAGSGIILSMASPFSVHGMNKNDAVAYYYQVQEQLDVCNVE